MQLRLDANAVGLIWRKNRAQVQYLLSAKDASEGADVSAASLA